MCDKTHLCVSPLLHMGYYSRICGSLTCYRERKSDGCTHMWKMPGLLRSTICPYNLCCVPPIGDSCIMFQMSATVALCCQRDLKHFSLTHTHARARTLALYTCYPLPISPLCLSLPVCVCACVCVCVCVVCVRVCVCVCVCVRERGKQVCICVYV